MNRSLYAFLGACAVVTACGQHAEYDVTGSTSGLVAPPSGPQGCVVGTTKVEIGDRTTTTGGAATDGLTLGSDAKITGNVNVYGNATLRVRGTINGNLDISGTLTGTPSQVTGTITRPGTAAQAVLPTQTFSVGTTPVTVASGTTRTIAPGNYAAGYVQARSNATLTTGTYDFATLTIEGDSYITLDTSGGPIEINVQGAVNIYSRAHFTAGDPNKVYLYSNGAAVSIQPDVQFPGTVVAPSATVTLADRVVVSGCVGGSKVLIGTDSKVTGTKSVTVPPEQPDAAPPPPPPPPPPPVDAGPDAEPDVVEPPPPPPPSDAAVANPVSTNLVVHPWNTGYCANLTVKNISTAQISNWKVALDLHQSTIVNSWSAVFTSTGVGLYDLTPMTWNAVLAPNQAAEVGFCATKTGTNFTPTVSVPPTL